MRTQPPFLETLDVAMTETKWSRFPERVVTHPTLSFHKTLKQEKGKQGRRRGGGIEGMKLMNNTGDVLVPCVPDFVGSTGDTRVKKNSHGSPGTFS